MITIRLAEIDKPVHFDGPILGQGALELPNRQRVPVQYGFRHDETIAIASNLRMQDGYYLIDIDAWPGSYQSMFEWLEEELTRVSPDEFHELFHIGYELGSPLIVLSGQLTRGVVRAVSIGLIPANPGALINKENAMKKHIHTWIRRSTHTHAAGAPTCRHFKCNDCGASKHDDSEE